jgi:ABC-type nitrate/sulfonate/bicarbonate transport system permease component
MIFNAKNRKIIQKVWAVISIIAIIGMVGFSLIALLR